MLKIKPVPKLQSHIKFFTTVAEISVRHRYLDINAALHLLLDFFKCSEIQKEVSNQIFHRKRLYFNRNRCA